MQVLETHLLHVTGTIENPPTSLLAGENPTSEGLTGRITEQDLLKGDPRAVQLITGADISYPRFSACTVTGIMVLARPDMEVVETRTTSGRMTFPYAPGYRSFREVPLLIRAFRRLRSQLSAFDVRRPGYGTSKKFRLGVLYGAAEGPSFDRLRKIGSVREKFGACIGG